MTKGVVAVRRGGRGLCIEGVMERVGGGGGRGCHRRVGLYSDVGRDDTH